MSSSNEVQEANADAHGSPIPEEGNSSDPSLEIDVRPPDMLAL